MKYCFIALAALSFACTKKQGDHSLTINEYKQMGIPDPGKIWNVDDLSLTYNALMKIKWDKPYLLPAKDSENSGLLFSRMVSPENMYFVKDDAMPLNERAQRISEFIRVYEFWIDLYVNPTFKSNYYSKEIVDIHLFKLLVTQHMLELANQINRSNDPADKVLQYGYKPIKENYINCLIDNFKMLCRPVLFLESDLDRMADSLHASIIRNRIWMDSTDISILSESSREVIDSAGTEHIRGQFRNLSKSLYPSSLP